MPAEDEPRFGAYTQPIKTSSPECQKLFDRGCVWAYNLHREEALSCFIKAAEADPSCAMAHAFVAFANAPEYNWNESGGFYVVAAQESGYPSFKVAVDAIGRASASLTNESPPREHALVGAFGTLFEWPITPEAADRKVAYADAMEAVANDARFADDADIQALAADAVMSLAPWQLYEPDKTPKPVATRARALLERGQRASPNHMYVCHLRVHLDEMGPVAAFDWRSAEALRHTDAADAGHLLHMPSHLDIQVGAYESAMAANTAAVEADLRQLARAPERFSIYTGYTVHNMEFCAWAAMYAGCERVALTAAHQLESFLDEEKLTAAAHLPTFFEAYLSTRLMVYVRFGKWESILTTPFKPDRQLYLAHTLFLHFARGIAFGAKGDVAAARAEQAAFVSLFGAMTPDTRRKHNVNLYEHTVPIAADVLDAEIAYREGQHEECFAKLEAAVVKYDALPYDEPAGYLMSPRQTLGALLAEQKRYSRAAQVYDADLRTFPKNIWSLAGLKLCLTGMGDAGSSRLPDVEAALAAAAAIADVRVCTSCACALESWAAALDP